MEDQETNHEDENEEEGEFILSLCWDSGILAATFYNLSTLELHVMNQTIDLSPDHIPLRDLFRQVEPAYLVATGPNSFLNQLKELLDLPEDTDINKFKVSKTNPANANSSNVSFFPFNRNNVLEPYRKKIYELDLPGLPAETSKNDRQIFIDSLFPMNQELVIIAVGNLLKYLNENHMKWRHVFLSLDRSPIITDVKVFYIESQVLLDDTTFHSLNIFSYVYHPSSFKNQVRKDGLSLFNLLNKCLSSVGVQELKSMLKQPSRDLGELNLRFATVEWCLKPENAEHVAALQGHLKNLLNINAIVARIVSNFGRTNDWKSLKKTVYFSFLICELCASLSDESIKSTFLCDLADFAKEEVTVKGILFALDKIVDLEGIETAKRFTVKEQVDPILDEKRESLREMMECHLEMNLDESLEPLTEKRNAFSYVHFPEMGFVVGTCVRFDELNLETIKEQNIELVLQTADATYFRTPNCKKLNEEYEQRLTSIIDHELRVFTRLITHVNESLAELIDISKLCAKLDVLISFANISSTYKFVKPNITTNKELVIVNGRHPLVQLIRDYIPSTTIINQTNQSYVNIISAPNASGKSVYMKQVALICYMAHVGMFVPADECTISLLHSIYTRIYTPESVYQCESAFMEDLQQMSRVIMNSTSRSLILVDEFGKGTHYKDGIALLAASIEHFVDRGDLSPIAFITTHYHQVHDLIKSKDFTSVKTIVTTKNASGVYESLYKITDGDSAQNFSTEFPESMKIMNHIFRRKEKDDEYEGFTNSYDIAIKSFVLILAKYLLRKGAVNYDTINELYSKVDVEKFIES